MFLKSLAQTAAVLGLMASSTVAFDPYTDPTGNGCVDPTGFRQCFQKSAAALVSCGEFCSQQTTRPYDECIVGCARTRLSTNLGCWIQSCWNQVYSCEYQLTAIQFLRNWDLIQAPGIVPYYPPPDVLGGGSCSCNLAYVYGNTSFTNFNNACLDAAMTGDRKILKDCQCCEFSFKLSNVITACPTTDLTGAGDLGPLIASTQQILADSTDQCAVLDNNPALCIDQYKFPFANDTVHNPFSLPEGRTEKVSNLAGNAFTERGDGVVTLALSGYTSTITLANFNTNAGAITTGLAGGGGGGGAVETASETASGVPSASATGAASTANSGTSSTRSGSASQPTQTRASSGAGKTQYGVMGLVGIGAFASFMASW